MYGEGDGDLRYVGFCRCDTDADSVLVCVSGIVLGRRSDLCKGQEG